MGEMLRPGGLKPYPLGRAGSGNSYNLLMASGGVKLGRSRGSAAAVLPLPYRSSPWAVFTTRAALGR